MCFFRVNLIAKIVTIFIIVCTYKWYLIIIWNYVISTLFHSVWVFSMCFCCADYCSTSINVVVLLVEFFNASLHNRFYYDFRKWKIVEYLIFNYFFSFFFTLVVVTFVCFGNHCFGGMYFTFIGETYVCICENACMPQMKNCKFVNWFEIKLLCLLSIGRRFHLFPFLLLLYFESLKSLFFNFNW